MSEIVWDLDKTFWDNSGNEIHVLQRPLLDLTNAKGEELLPFFNEVSFFQLRAAEQRDQIEAVKGILIDLRVEGVSVMIETKLLEGRGTITWTIQDLKSTLLSIWRVNDILDTIQVKIDGEPHKIYMQVGGASLSDMFIKGKSGDSHDIEKAVEIFNRNVYV